MLFDWVEYLINVKVLNPNVKMKLDTLLDGYLNGYIEYEQLVSGAADIYLEAIKMINSKMLISCEVKFFKQDINKLFPFVEPLIKKLQKLNFAIAVISGAPESLLKYYREYFRIEKVFGLQIGISKGTSKELSIIKNYGLIEEKKNAVSEVMAKYKVIRLSIGNAKADLPLFESAISSFLIKDEAEILLPGVKITSVTNILNDIVQDLQ